MCRYIVYKVHNIITTLILLSLLCEGQLFGIYKVQDIVIIILSGYHSMQAYCMLDTETSRYVVS